YSSLLYQLQARPQWYRVLNQKLPTASYLHQIDTVDSHQCRLCHAEEESLDYFLVTCSIKQDIWMMALSHRYPTFSFTTDHILSALFQLQAPFPSKSDQVIPLLVLISTTHCYIWFYYWQLIIKEVTFRPDHIIKTINHQVTILL
ncbi:hypothetical protein BD770DRAFT_304252, partial [Pilaira anomala]